MSSSAASLDELEEADEQPPTPVAVPDLLKQPAKSPKETEISQKDAGSGPQDAEGGLKSVKGSPKDAKPSADQQVGPPFLIKHFCTQ